MVVSEARRDASTVTQLFVRGRPNSLNMLRLTLAVCVIVWHTYYVLGLAKPADPGLYKLLGSLPVNGFFALSGFLIYRSWVNRPKIGSFLIARLLRIYPAFWVCLVATAALFAPIAAALQGKDWLAQLFSWETIGYFANNISLAMLQWRIGDSPSDVPWLMSWNLSLWTLAWECLCYLALMVLGILGMQRRKWMLPAAFVAAVALNLLTILPQFDIEVIGRAGRFSIFFICGALVAQHADVIVSRWSWAIAAIVVMLASAWLPGQLSFVVQAPAAAYGLIALGGLFRPRWAELRNDISYGVYIYAFPVQLLLVVAGFTNVGLGTFSLVALAITVPLALASWFWVEKPALRLRKKFTLSPKRDVLVADSLQ